MSRIGKQPIPVPTGVKVAIAAKTREVSVTGPKGTLKFVIRPEMTVAVDDTKQEIICGVDDMTKVDVGNRRAYWGTTRATINNMIKGVTAGYAEKLEVNGVGYVAKLQGKNLVLNVGFCHPIIMAVPAGVTCVVEGNAINISGTDKQAVGGFAAQVRMQRKPEPYNGKGIKYATETITRKQGKAFGA